jgi:putative DNA methylase
MLLPQTDDPEKDLEIFEQLMAFDDAGLARREPKIAPAEIARRITLDNPWAFFSFSFKGDPEDIEEIESASFPLGRR